MVLGVGWGHKEEPIGKSLRVLRCGLGYGQRFSDFPVYKSAGPVGYLQANA